MMKKAHSPDNYSFSLLYGAKYAYLHLSKEKNP